MVDLSVFRDPRFSGASLAVTALFFALTSATFLLTQVYQLVLGYSPLSAGLRSLPSALMIITSAPLAARAAAKTGPRTPVVAGLMLATAGLGIFATATSGSGYGHYLIAMVTLCVGIGLTMSPATTSIMSALPPAKAGVGSAINDTARNIGSVLGIAVIGSVVASVYSSHLAPAATHLGRHIADQARQSLGAATQIAHHINSTAGHQLATAAHHAFITAIDHGLLIAAAVTLTGAVIAARSLPRHAAASTTTATPTQPATVRA